MHLHLLAWLIRADAQVRRGIASWHDLAWNRATATGDERYVLALVPSCTCGATLRAIPGDGRTWCPEGCIK